jgi:hypothetical protein
MLRIVAMLERWGQNGRISTLFSTCSIEHTTTLYAALPNSDVLEQRFYTGVI